MAPQPKESLEAIYEWVGDWDQTWAGIYLWWKYIDENKISIPKVCDANLHDMTEESLMEQNEDYQEQVKERAHLEAERLAKAPSVHTWGQTARDEGQDHVPEDTEGDTARGGTHSAGGGCGSAIKGKGKQQATSEEDELANNIDDNKGNGTSHDWR
ncbi:hypothetical protein M404DRAFT_24569 [Pisolithus tinctorius Marx 270]|uniref:Uncharacterized protein n=1 Tax=Pisolithus tinctorius Marx 270 TaxID=870435 RepID=A0A0C3PDR0_PISTI|nr:hypothetical protein M404DRAFT_24569 [Pisolithus tinctorius Marx 270]